MRRVTPESSLTAAQAPQTADPAATSPINAMNSRHFIDHCANGGHHLLFNHFVRAGKQRRRHLKSERLGGIQVDYQFDPRRLLDGEFASFGPI